METDHELPEFGTGLRAHLESHGVAPGAPRCAIPTSDLFALFEPSPPPAAPPRRGWLRPAYAGS